MAKKEEKFLTAQELVDFLSSAEDAYSNAQTKVLFRYADDREEEVAQFEGFYISKVQKDDGSIERKLVFVLP